MPALVLLTGLQADIVRLGRETRSFVDDKQKS